MLDFELIFGYGDFVFGDGVFLVLEEGVDEIGHLVKRISVYFYYFNLF